MIKIRLSRGGVKGSPFYRIIAIDERKKRAGKAREVLGIWYPRKGLTEFSKEKLNQWVAKGAQVTTVVKNLIEKRS
jgi:small subunit ribosomal protein S16